MYTIDLEHEKLEVEFTNLEEKRTSAIQRKKLKVQAKEAREELMMDLLLSKISTKELFDEDPNIRYMRLNFRPEFYSKWNEGLQLYFEGDWPQAKLYFEETIVFFA